jgi:hypothetical protein
MTVIKDQLGQEILLGDVVVGASGSSASISLVTRHGAKDNVQLNACGYTYGSYLVRITEQYIQAMGQESYEDLKDKYKIITEPVKKNKVAVTYVVVRVKYSLNSRASHLSPIASRYFVFEIIGDTSGERFDYWAKQGYNAVIENKNTNYYTNQKMLKVRKPSLYNTAGPYFTYFSSANGISRRALVSTGLGLERWVNQEITDPNTILALEVFKD